MVLELSGAAASGSNPRVEQGAWRRLWLLLIPGLPRRRDLLGQVRRLRADCAEARAELETLRVRLEMEIIRREAVEARVTT
ncbi:hypothetical protein GCM10009665_21650 [Kitasatospora nipponensis]|uniref:MerR-like DNA binding protein n=1 Tax=Kitasatospora nipponensis TaxID=258049 RepID=A0ABP4GMX3_9ACTN